MFRIAAQNAADANARLAAMAAQRDELLRLLKIAQPEWCSLRCPSIFRGPDSARHLQICDDMRAAIHACGGDVECPHGTVGPCSWCDLRDDGGLPESQVRPWEPDGAKR